MPLYVLAVLCLFPIVSWATETEFHEVYSLWTIFWVSAWSIFGCIVSYSRRLSRGEIKKFKLMEFIGELFVSGFTGWITFILGRKSGLDVDIVYCMAGIAGHMGTRCIFFMEQFVEQFFNFIASRFLSRENREEYQKLFPPDTGEEQQGE
jgi:hypothetical protein